MTEWWLIVNTATLQNLYMQLNVPQPKKIIPEHDNIQVYLFKESKIQLNETKNNIV